MSFTAQRYTAWLRRRALLVLLAALAMGAVALWLALYRLPVQTDFAALLPPDAQSVRDLHRIEARVPNQGAILVVVVAPDPDARAAIAADMARGARALGSRLVARVDTDDTATRRFFRDHVELYVPVDDLVKLRDALADRIRREKLRANPLYVDLEDAPAPQAEDPVDSLRDRRRDALEKLDRSGYVSRDGRVQLVAVRTAFPKTDLAGAETLIHRLRDLRTRTLADHGVAGADVGFAGDVMHTVVEHSGLIRSMTLSAVITAFLVGLIVLLYLRRIVVVAALGVSLSLAVVATLGFAALAIGHLNVATAFLIAIVAGNGVNYGLLLSARYNEERGRGRSDRDEALSVALAGTARPTLVASAGAGVAYGALAVTSFRGFSEFAVIGAVGMALSWLSAFTVLPAMLLVGDRRAAIPAAEHRVSGRIAMWIGHRKRGEVIVAAALLAVAASAIAVRYVASDPFEYDVKRLRSDTAEAVASRRWKQLSDDNFGRNVAGATYIAVDRPAQVPLVVDALRAADAHHAPNDATFGEIQSILDAIPPDQDRRIALLDSIRALLDDSALRSLDDDERAELAELRPPDDLRQIRISDLPSELQSKLRERDGRIGLLIRVRPGPRLDMWNGRDLIRFANAIRRVDLADGSEVTTSGSGVVFADIVEAIRSDGPLATEVAAIGVLLLVLGLVGITRVAAAVLSATALGTVWMLAVVALLGVRVNFLDFVALPLTIGLGVDYAINIGYRARAEGDTARALRGSGTAVLLCSATTIIAYGSLLLSANGAVRSFGLSALIGEVCCVVAALALVPALVRGRGATTAHVAAEPARGSVSTSSQP